MWLTAALALLSKIPGTALSLFTGINVGAVFSGIGTFFGSLCKNIITYWKEWLLALLVGGLVFSTWEWRSTDTKLVKERAAHAADIASFKKAQADADTKAQQERVVLQKESKANADQADATYSTLAAKYHTSLLRYAEGHKGTTSEPNNYQLSTPEGGDGPSSSSDLPSTITISGGDANICATNTARLQAVHDWATTLPKSGSVIP